MGDTITNSGDTHSIIHPKNALNGVLRLFGGDIDDTKANVQGELLWVTLIGYVLGNSLGTRNTMNGVGRVHLGPVYIW
jgi:hypothetical protein